MPGKEVNIPECPSVAGGASRRCAEPRVSHAPRGCAATRPSRRL